MPDETDPPRKNYGFKEREFKRDNRAPSASQPPINTQDLAKQAGPVTRSIPVPSTVPKAGDPNDPFAKLQENRAAAARAGADAIEIRPVSNRRKKDYWLLLIAGILVIALAPVILGANVMTLAFAGGGIIVYSLGLTWVMWQVMGKY